MLRPCHLVPFLCPLVATVTLSGCFLWHDITGAPAERDAGVSVRSDAGLTRRVDARVTPSIDAALDAAVFDAALPPFCDPRLPDFACTDTGNGAVPVGVPYALPIGVGGLEQCFCGETFDCTARIVGPNELELETAFCSESFCEACLPFVHGSCALPPLTEGDWTVSFAGRRVFELRVSDVEPGIGPVEACVTPAHEALICEVDWSPRPEPIDQLCVPLRMPAGMPIPIEVTDFCIGCGQVPGSCEVIRTADSIRVTPRALPPACDIDCDGCEFAVSTCVIPPLPPGEYTVEVLGRPEAAILTIEDGIEPGGATTCLSTPEDD